MTVSWAEWVSSLSQEMTCLFWDMLWTVLVAVFMSKLMEAREAMAVPLMHCSVSQLVTVSARSG